MRILPSSQPRILWSIPENFLHVWGIEYEAAEAARKATEEAAAAADSKATEDPATTDESAVTEEQTTNE